MDKITELKKSLNHYLEVINNRIENEIDKDNIINGNDNTIKYYKFIGQKQMIKTILLDIEYYEDLEKEAEKQKGDNQIW